MAIDQISYKEADHFARAQKSFYPVSIPVSHWQLRHYISNPEPDLLYYASGHDIYCLNTATKKRRHIITLPFEARCTASGYGWICVGGEDEGHFAAIKLDGSTAPRSAVGVDEALPLDGRQMGWGGLGNNTRRAASVKVERIGEEIVNSISIHRIQDESAHLDDIVAVLTNNDHTVRVYSLPQALETTVLDLPFPINHATVSPDGQMLIAVGDFNEAYFFSREIKGEVPQIPKPHNRLTSMNIEWALSHVVSLHSSSPELTSGYFTTAWSPNGRLCAVGSEGGYITIFDIDILADPSLYDEDAIVLVVPSTRPDLPQPHPGAVRTMMFSPDPWDLLIWAEDQGRICIGDLRNGLKSRQIISLEPKDEALEKVECEILPNEDETISVDQRAAGDNESLRELEADFIRRNGPISDALAAANFSSEYFAARRRQRQARQDAAQSRSQSNTPSSRRPGPLPDDDVQGLTSHEQQVLDALRTTRQRIEARTPSGQIPRSINYTSSEMFNHGGTANSNRSSTASTPNNGSGSGRPINDILSSVRDELPQLARTSATPPSRLDESERDSNTLPPLRTFTVDLPIANTEARKRKQVRHQKPIASFENLAANPNDQTIFATKKQYTPGIESLQVQPGPKHPPLEIDVDLEDALLTRSPEPPAVLAHRQPSGPRAQLAGEPRNKASAGPRLPPHQGFVPFREAAWKGGRKFRRAAEFLPQCGCRRGGGLGLRLAQESAAVALALLGERAVAGALGGEFGL